MADLSKYTIRDIESMTEQEAIKAASDTMTYKGYNIYFVDFGGYFGFSRLVFKNGAHIYFSNDYELHHNGKTKEELKELYINSLKYKLFVADDMKTITSYEDAEQKEYWIRNYFPQEFKHYSMFCFVDSPESKLIDELKAANKIYPSMVCFCYFEDIYIVEMAKKLINDLDQARENANTLEYWINAFEHELYNHEYLINLQGNWDLFSAFGNVVYKGDKLDGMAEIADYMKQLGIFDKMHLDAFKQAYDNYYKVAINY